VDIGVETEIPRSEYLKVEEKVIVYIALGVRVTLHLIINKFFAAYLLAGQ